MVPMYLPSADKQRDRGIAVILHLLQNLTQGIALLHIRHFAFGRQKK